MTKKNVVVFLIFIIFAKISYTQVVRYSNDFVNIGVGARNMALGSCTIADIDDYTSGYYNPAGLSNLKNKYQGGILHSEYFAGIAKYDYAGFAYKLADSVGISVSFIRLGVDDIQNTLYLYDDNGDIDYDRIQLFSVADYALLVSLGKKSLIKGLSYGINAKIIYRSQGEFAKAYGFGIDLGVQYSIINWNFGVKLSNATTSFTAWYYNINDQMRDVFIATNNDLPENSLEITLPILSSGVSRYWQLSEKIGVKSEFNLITTFDGQRNALLSFEPISFYPQIGIELNYLKKFFLRTGFYNFQLIPNFGTINELDENSLKEKDLDFVPSIGVGINFHNFTLDYALTDVANQSLSLYSHIFSISFRLN